MSATENVLLQTLLKSGTITGILAIGGYLSRKTLKMPVTRDPSSSFENFAIFTASLAGALYGYDYLVKEKVIPTV